jgi:hypothetical protein
VTSSAGSATASSGVFPLTVTSGEKLGLTVDVNISNSITASGQTISAVNLAAANVLTGTVLQAPSRTSDPASGQLAHIGDIYGVVSNVSASAQGFTLQTAYRGTISVTANSSTTYDPACSAQSFSFVISGALAAVDAILNADGTLAVRNYSPVRCGFVAAVCSRHTDPVAIAKTTRRAVSATYYTVRVNMAAGNVASYF